MENKVSEKIRLILNELAILNQPEQKENKIFYRLEDLLKIRSLSAELYLNTDMAAQTGEVFQAAAPVFEPVPKVVSAPFVESEDHSVPETMEQVETQPEVEMIAEPQVAEMNILDAQIDTHEPSEQLQEQNDFKPPRITAEQIASQISFTRRFEYINQLFGGNTELFMEFLDEMGYSRDTAHAMEIFDKHYFEKNWQRKQESAFEFKRLLQRSC